MNSLTQLNTFSQANVTFSSDLIEIDFASGNTFQHQPVTWNAVRTLGVLSGTGVQITYTLTGNTVITFPDSSFATHTLSIATVGNVTTVGNVRDVLDYNAARARIDPNGQAGNINYTVAYINTNNLLGNIIASYRGVPV
jgi:hypothetical protein